MTPNVIVVGAGPAGIAAAARASGAGASVTVLDDNSSPGGQIWRGSNQAPRNRQAAAWLRRFHATPIHTISNAQVISADAAAHSLLVETPETVLELHFDKLILATGARELYLPFPNWTLPGIFGVGGLQALAKSGLPVKGKRIVLAGSGPLLLAVAAHLRKKGARITLIAEQASRGSLMKFASRLVRYPGKLAQAAALQLSLFSIPYHFDCWVEAAEGDSRLEALRIRQGNCTWKESCDLAGIAFGLCPNTELADLLGCRRNGNAVAVDEWQRTSQPNIFCAGEATGVGGVDLSLLEGEIAGLTAVDRSDEAAQLFQKRAAARAFACSLDQAFALRAELKNLPQADTFICRCEDVPRGRLEEFPSFRAAKLHTRCGMGPCQGRICGPAAEFLFDWKNESIRPPIYAARVGSFLTPPPSQPHAE